jgi:hypothetical protein
MVNKSKIAREFWRKIFKENQIDLRNSDARKSVVNEFIQNNKGWNSTTDKRFFRSAFDKVSKEFGMSTSQFGVKPEPSKAKKTVGTLNISAKTDEKKVHPLYTKEDEAKQTQQPTKTITQQELEQQQMAVTYSANAVGEIFSTMFNIFHSRYPMCTKLTEGEKMQLGEAWMPIFNEYFQTGNKFVLPAIATIPIVLVRFAQYNTYRKEEQLAKEYGITPPEKKQTQKDEKRWGNFNEKKTDKK